MMAPSWNCSICGVDAVADFRTVSVARCTGSSNETDGKWNSFDNYLLCLNPQCYVTVLKRLIEKVEK